MSKAQEHADDEWIDVTPEERAELESAIAEADADPDGGIEWGEFMRRLRNGE